MEDAVGEVFDHSDVLVRTLDPMDLPLPASPDLLDLDVCAGSRHLGTPCLGRAKRTGRA